MGKASSSSPSSSARNTKSNTTKKSVKNNKVAKKNKSGSNKQKSGKVPVKVERRGRPKGRKTTSHPFLVRPKRPRSAYNFFFQQERGKILKEEIENKQKQQATTDAATNTGIGDGSAADGKPPKTSSFSKGTIDSVLTAAGIISPAITSEATSAVEPKDNTETSSTNKNNEPTPDHFEILVKTNPHCGGPDGKKKRGRPQGVHYRPRKIEAKHGLIEFRDLARKVATRWNSLSDEEKKPYVEQAKVELKYYEEAIKKFVEQVKILDAENSKDKDSRTKDAKTETSPSQASKEQQETTSSFNTAHVPPRTVSTPTDNMMEIEENLVSTTSSAALPRPSSPVTSGVFQHGQDPSSDHHETGFTQSSVVPNFVNSSVSVASLAQNQPTNAHGNAAPTLASLLREQQQQQQATQSMLSHFSNSNSGLAAAFLVQQQRQNQQALQFVAAQAAAQNHHQQQDQQQRQLEAILLAGAGAAAGSFSAASAANTNANALVLALQQQQQQQQQLALCATNRNAAATLNEALLIAQQQQQAAAATNFAVLCGGTTTIPIANATAPVTVLSAPAANINPLAGFFSKCYY